MPNVRVFLSKSETHIAEVVSFSTSTVNPSRLERVVGPQQCLSCNKKETPNLISSTSSVTVGVSLPVTPSTRLVLWSHEVAFYHVYRTTSSAHSNWTSMISFLIFKPSHPPSWRIPPQCWVRLSPPRSASHRSWSSCHEDNHGSRHARPHHYLLNGAHLLDCHERFPFPQ